MCSGPVGNHVSVRALARLSGLVAGIAMGLVVWLFAASIWAAYRWRNLDGPVVLTGILLVLAFIGAMVIWTAFRLWLDSRSAKDASAPWCHPCS
jgi:thiol:disulfide interchange protein